MQTRTNPFVLMAALYLTVGLVAVVGKLTVDTGLLESLPRLRWLSIHFVTIGGMTQALFGLLPSLTSGGGRSEWESNSGLRWLQWLLLNVGYPLVLLGMATGSTTTAIAGATFVLAALGLLLVTVFRSTDASQAVADHYRIAPWFLVVGILAAFGMLLNVHGPGGYFGSIEAHVHANVWGFLALVVAGALLTILPALLDTDLRYPRVQRVTFWGLSVGAAGLVAGPWLAVQALTMAGLGIYVAGTVALLANVVGTYRASERGWDSRGALVLGAYLWLVFPVPWAPLVLLFPETVPGGVIEMAAINGLVFGWMLQLAMAFLPVASVAIGRSGDEGLVANMAAAADDVAAPNWGQVAAVNVGMVALWGTAVVPGGLVSDWLTTGGFALVAVAWSLFVVSLWRSIGTVQRNRRVSRDDLRGTTRDDG